MINRTGLVPPYSGNSGDGNASEQELTTADEIREQIEAPFRNACAGALKDAISYLVHNATSDADDSVDVRQSLNIRWNLPWTEVDAIIREAQPLAEREIEKAKAKRIKIEKEENRFDALADQFAALGLKIKLTDGMYTLSDLTESQLKFCGNALTANVGKEKPETAGE